MWKVSEERKILQALLVSALQTLGHELLTHKRAILEEYKTKDYETWNHDHINHLKAKVRNPQPTQHLIKLAQANSPIGGQ